jgi:prepilin-type N-terminal cleavage/methylation domain-containing protein
MKRRTCGFSLIELIIVLGIITLLLAILLPAIARSREQASRTTCANNLRQWAVALRSYAAVNDNAFPYNGGAIPPGIPVGGKGLSQNSTVVQQFWKDYLVSDWSLAKRAAANVLFCPNQFWLRSDDQDDLENGACGYFYLPSRDPANSGGTQYYLAGDWWVQKKKFGGPSRATPIASDISEYDSRAGSWLPYTSHTRRDGGPAGGNFLFEDGHVAWYGYRDIDLAAVNNDGKQFFYRTFN